MEDNSPRHVHLMLFLASPGSDSASPRPRRGWIMEMGTHFVAGQLQPTALREVMEFAVNHLSYYDRLVDGGIARIQGVERRRRGLQRSVRIMYQGAHAAQREPRRRAGDGVDRQRTR